MTANRHIGPACFDPARIERDLAAGDAGRVSLPEALMERAHAEKLRICDIMEEIADALPSRVDRMKCLGVANILVPTMRVIHAHEEDTVFSAFVLAGGVEGARSSVSRLRAEHVEDECSADEITETLMAIGRGGQIGNPEALGYMLRAFFDKTRRHIAFEREHVLPAIRRAACASSERGT